MLDLRVHSLQYWKSVQCVNIEDIILGIFLVIDDFTLLDIEGANNGKMKPRVPNIEVEIT